MNGDQLPGALYYALWLMLVISALVSRRLPGGKMVKMALIWLAIFATAILLFSLLKP